MIAYGGGRSGDTVATIRLNDPSKIHTEVTFITRTEGENMVDEDVHILMDITNERVKDNLQ